MFFLGFLESFGVVSFIFFLFWFLVSFNVFFWFGVVLE